MILANRYDVSGLCGSWIDSDYGSDRINEMSRVRAARLNILILLKISASDAAVKSILRTAASTGMDTESQINLLRVATRWLEAQTVLRRYLTSVPADPAAELTFPLSDLTEIAIRLARPPIPSAARSIVQPLPLPVWRARRVREWAW